MGGGKGGSSTRTVPSLPVPFRQPIEDIGLGMIDPAARQKQFAKMFLDPSSVERLKGVMSETAYGGRLNVLSDPAVQNYTSALTNLSNTNLKENLAGLQSEAARSAGLTSVGRSSILQGMMADQIRRSQENLNATLAPTLLNLYDTERGRQLAAVGGTQQMEMLPFNVFQDILQTVRGQTSNTRNTGGVGWINAIMNK